jgi:hypothetical protein
MDLDDLRGWIRGWRGGLRGSGGVSKSEKSRKNQLWKSKKKEKINGSGTKETQANTKELQGRYALQVPISGSKGLRKDG